MSTLTFISLIFVSLNSYYIAAAGQSNFQRSLQFLNASASKPTGVSPNFQELGYTSDHTSNCTFMIYGIPENTAAGDRDMNVVSKLVKGRFNSQINAINESLPLLVTQVEVISQKLGDGIRRRRRLSTSSDRRLITSGYNSAFFMVRYACKGCSTDNRDARRKLHEALSESEFVNELETDLMEGNSVYFSQALQETRCFKFSCDGGMVHETDGCKDIERS
jgi:hypothetical protein